MKFSGVLSALTFATAASATTVSYDTGYDDGNRAMTSVACSDGKNGLITRYGFNKQSDIPRFPYIGGVYTIAGWNSPNCGSCFRVEYQGRKIHVLAIDHAGEGVNMGLRAMNDLTNGKAAQLGRINAQVYHAKPTDCGLKA
ncbi:hypothetical protein BHE90_016437 [Fusarium euwallaceae]|uniref:Eliciting plant response-like protein n=4 Tax=Fusarium solani species complex TaxID=232080 RepID=A0A428RYH7_9HYPO|nr:hypothetical protein CEP53_012606 [Fusarium sp. AF-6]RSL82609.1 hypothetical protein CEP52_016920 [Fusarium oligoseptatum]RSL87946.1 hypothetical protein CEP51_001956 [Fusarium floridanum]RSM17549.1 hypothetical protein CDV31_003625 [Fusarium ambrosium]RTE69181.1 hypothetical protein BHE90_016437 [Fusarium euwallaceae]